MAFWAKVMFWAIIAQTILAMGALIALILDLRQNRKSAEAQLRAYLSFKDFELDVLETESKDSWNLRLQTQLRNSGPTPAYDCIHMGNLVAFSEEQAVAYFENSKNAPRIGRRTPYAVHSGLDTGAAFESHEPMNRKAADEIGNGEKRLYAFGEAEYRDTFGVIRYTRFCLILRGDLFPKHRTPGGKTVTEIIWETAPFHNDAT